MLKKLIVVYNPRASKYAAVEREVLAITRNLQGWLVGRYEVKAEPFNENMMQLAGLLQDGDLVVSVGGDGTASLTMNAIMHSKKKVTYSSLGYGDFNDVARLLKTQRAVEYGEGYIGGITEIIERYEKGKIGDLYPLEVKLNGELYRYGLCYFTVGLLADATQVFSEPKVRARLQKKQKGVFYSWRQLFYWYLKNRQRQFLPTEEIVIEHKPMNPTGQPEVSVSLAQGTTDYLAVNSPRVVRIMKGNMGAKKAEVFESAAVELGGTWQMVKFVLRSTLAGLPTKKTCQDTLMFAQPATVMVQTDGEFEELHDVKRLRISKVKRPLKVVKF